MNSNKIIITLDDGTTVTYDIVLMVTNNFLNKNYVFFTDNSEEDGKIVIYGSTFKIVDEKIIINEPTEEETKDLEEMFEIFELKDGYKNNIENNMLNQENATYEVL